MTAHAEILDQPESLRGSLIRSLILHASIAGLIVAFVTIKPGKPELWGDINGGGFGSVTVGVVSSIPLPSRLGRLNPVANDTESSVPAPPPSAAKPQPKVQAEDLDAIPIKSRNATRRAQTAAPASPSNKWSEQQRYRPNQLYSSGGAAAVSSMYQMTGGGGVGVGTRSPFGTQLGWYATLLRDQVAQKWRTADIDARLRTAPPTIVRFTMQRDGSLVPGSVRVVQTSGVSSIDYSAQRAIMDAAPFPAIPRQFPRDTADIELQFELRR